MNRCQLPLEAEVVERVQETPNVFTLHLRFTDPAVQTSYRFHPGQFNMLYLYGVGEIPISIVSDPEHTQTLTHTVRVVGRVSRGFDQLTVGDRIGVRGPFGRGWPVEQAKGGDLLVVTGGLGCAPAVSVIDYVMRRRDGFGRLMIVQGVKHRDDLIWREQYEQWMEMPNTQVLLAADVGDPGWQWHVGLVTELFDQLQWGDAPPATMICGPEPMMAASARRAGELGVPEDRIWLSMERNMQCATGHCGHCQFGPAFVCKDGPVFSYPEIKAYLGQRGF